MRKSTRDRIVDAAVELFNADGVGNVTTNHIAAHLGMSPGNLYYHFANKEEIVRAAFTRMNDEAAAIWSLPEPPQRGATGLPDPASLQRMIVGNLRLYATYLFFARELSVLLRADPELRKSYAAVSASRMKQLEDVLASLEKAGLVTGLDAEDRRDLAEASWMIGMVCVPYAEAMDASPTPRSAKGRAEKVHHALERGALLVLHMFRPYMDPLAYTGLVVLVRSELEKLVT